MTPKHRIDDFLDQKRFAFVGLSRRPNDFSRALFREFIAKGWNPVPVNPEAVEIEGESCYAHVNDIQPPVDSALLMTSPQATALVAGECVSAGMKRVWFFRGPGSGPLNQQAVDACEAAGVSVIAGECPLMFLPHPVWIHRVHAFVKKIRGTYPSAEFRTS
ncbi:MAG TPA: CoA-binding protein [Candidatus Acidoferrales bacterium]|nr:CoA-binding protein [Candidatus Acidoferrales bacterium]